MFLSARSVLALTAFALVVSCGSDGPLSPVGGEFNLGQTLPVESGREVRVLGGTSGGTFLAVVVNLAQDTLGKTPFTLRASGVEAVMAGAFGARAPEPDADRAPVTSLRRDALFESRVRDIERTVLTPRFAAARRWQASVVPSLPTTVAVGDLVSINVNMVDACTNPTMHAARVVAVGSKAIILNDTLNPKPGFTTADYQRFAARFDTLVYPLDVAAFGQPTDIDNNGHIAIVFTRAVNELTPRGSSSYVGGLTFSRDIFPQTTTPRALACPASNVGEYFYLMTPDPGGTLGPSRTNAFVDSNSTAIIAHEFVHLINASRKLYINTAAPKFEEKWLDEGLAHVAEELLFYRVAGLAPRSNIRYQTLVSSARIRNAYLNDMSGNAGRYHDYLSNPANGSPFKAGDSLSTRGAAWSFLRYLADRTASTDGTIWARLIDNSATGVANLQSVFGEIPPLLRDWSVSHGVDDTPAASPERSQQSWNWRSIYGGPDGLAPLYPLPVTSLTPAIPSYTGTLVAGGVNFYTFEVPASGTGTLTLTGSSGGSSANLQLVIVRTQ